MSKKYSPKRVPGCLALMLGSCISFSSAYASSMTVHSGGNLQAALNQAVGGDTITIDAGAIFTGNFYLPTRSGTGFITVIGSGHSSIANGNFFTRVSPSDASRMPKIMTPNDSPAISVAGASASYWNLVNLEISGNDSNYVQDLIRIGNGNETTSSSLPQFIIINQCYIHTGAAFGKRGIAMNGGETIVANSWIDGFKSTWQDTQDLGGWNGPGPYQIVNNQLNSGTETLFFGGAVPANTNNIPSNVMVLGNDFYHDRADFSVPYLVKNSIEVKFGNRIFVHGNTFDGNHAQSPSFGSGGQKGFSIVLPPRSERDAVSWASVQDIWVSKNLFRNTDSGIQMAGADDSGVKAFGRGFFFMHNLFSGMNTDYADYPYGGVGRVYQITGGASDVEIQHTTALDNPDGPVVFENGFPYHNFSYSNNISMYAGGVQNGCGMDGSTALSCGVTGVLDFQKNVLIGSTRSTYPSTTSFTSYSGVGLGSAPYFMLSGNSAYQGAASDGYGSGNYNVGAILDPGYVTALRRVMIVNKSNGYCLQPANPSPGAAVKQFPCYAGLSQFWVISPVSTGWKIQNEYTGQYLEVAAGSSGTGAAIDQTALFSAANSREIWNFSKSTHNYFFTLTPNSDKNSCLAVANYSPYWWDPVNLGACAGYDANEEWSIVEAAQNVVSFPGGYNTQP